MRALLDTSSFLWFISGSDRLSIDAKNVIADLQNQIVLSVASLWEIRFIRLMHASCYQ